MVEINEGNERRGGRFRLVKYPDNRRDAATLIQIIQDNIEAGTTIVWDYWRAYSGLQNLGYTQFTVNHSYNFVDPSTGANTQTLESEWRAFKRSIHQGGRLGENKTDLKIGEYLWRRETKRLNLDCFESFYKCNKT